MPCQNSSSQDLKLESQHCAASENGCLRCDAVPASPIPANASAVLFAPRDTDAFATLHAVLLKSEFKFTSFGPLLIVGDVRDRLTELGEMLKTGLSHYTQSCIQTAYSPVGIETIADALRAMVFASPMTTVVKHIEHEWIRTALNENWLYSVFHPIVDSRSGDVYANEALLRARNPQEAKVIGAFPIIDACEKLNLIHQLDQRARRLAIAAAAQHLPASSRIFINFLPNTIYDPEVCLRTTMEAANKHHVSMDRLVFEVVETEQIPDMENLCKILDYYRNRGVGTAIDDMGAGFAGADYITALRPDFVKLDREFMLKAEASAEGLRLMDLMIAESHRINAKVIAEGIETAAQMKMCVNAGVDFLQGFLFAKPACPPQPVTFPINQRQAA